MDQKIIIVIVILISLLSISISVSIYISNKSSSSYITTTPNPILTTTTPNPILTTNIPITTATVQQTPSLVNFVSDTNKAVAWKGMEYHTNQDLSGLDYRIACDKPWNAYYQFGCKLPTGNTLYTLPKGPVSYGNFQGPKIRIAPENQYNYCTLSGGTLSVLRQRPGDIGMVDITSNLSNEDMSGTYDGVSSTFVDYYNTDC